MQSANTDIQAIATARRLTHWAAYYVIGLLSVVVFLLGDLGYAILLILVTEVVAFFWRPTPRLGPSSYSAPTPAAWQTPIRAVRWFEILSGCWATAGAALLATVGFVIFVIVFIVLIASRHLSLGLLNVAVAVLIAGWLLTRPLWRPALMQSLGQSSQGLRRTLSQWAPAVYVTADGFDVDFKTLIVGLVGRRHRLAHIAFTELDDVRTLAWIDAEAYAQALTTSDATLWPRMVWEFGRFMQGKLPRPSVFIEPSIGAHLLLHGPTLLYLIGQGDAWAPGAVAAWEAWRATQAPAAHTPTA